MKRTFSSWDIIQIQGKKILIAGIVILIPLYLFAPFALLQFVCVLFLFILIGSRVYSEYLVRNIRISRRDSEYRGFRQEWVQIELKVENHGLLPAFMLIISDTTGMLSVSKDHKALHTLLRRSWVLFKWQGFCAERGIFTLGPAIIRGSDPLGLFPFQLTAHETSRLFVYPGFFSINLKAPKGIPLGNMISPNPLYEDISRRRSLRPYQRGDEPRRINWKVSARITHAGVFMINEYDATASYPLMIFLNVDKNDYSVRKQGAYIERAIEAAATLCLKASRERQELGIIIYTSCQEEGLSVITPSAFTLIPILERLAALDWSATPDAPPTESGEGNLRSSARAMLNQGKYLPYGTRFLYTGPDLGDEAYMSLNILKKYHLFLEYLVIDEHSLLPLVPGNSPRYKMKESGYDIV
jgi:hypothetical protein